MSIDGRVEVCLEITEIRDRPDPSVRIGSLIDEATYNRLLRRAKSLLSREASAYRMEPADLVHDAFLRVARGRNASLLQDTRHFMAVCVIVMQHVLVDNVRGGRGKGENWPEPLNPEMHSGAEGNDDLGALTVRKAVQRLTAQSPRLGRVVRLRYFHGLTLEEIAAIHSLSSRTVKRDWQDARKWLARELLSMRPRHAEESVPLRRAA
jgi:RNA polymerase sigma factor (TIGR02999 family)